MRLAAALLLTLPLHAQSEAALKRAFEGRQIRVRLDMPATKYGVDVRYRQDPAVDFPSYGQRIKQYGVALREGDTSRITEIKVKDKVIEFQLDGGGYGTWGDESSYVSTPTYGRSDRERQLDREIEREPDPRRKDQLRRERARLEDMRRRQEQWDRQRADELKEMKEVRIAEKRLRGGSRFNIRYPENYLKETVPAPEEIMALLEPYVDFGDLTPRRPVPSVSAPKAPQPRLTPPNSRDLAAAPAAAKATEPSKKTMTLTAASPIFKLKRGLTRGEVESILGGPPASTRRSKQGNQDVDTDIWVTKDSVYEVDYVADIVVRYRMEAK